MRVIKISDTGKMVAKDIPFTEEQLSQYLLGRKLSEIAPHLSQEDIDFLNQGKEKKEA